MSQVEAVDTESLIDCAMCGRKFESTVRTGDEFCSRECYFEHERNRHDPDRIIVKKLVSDWSGKKLFRRVRANLADEWSAVQIHCWIALFQFNDMDTAIDHVANRIDEDAPTDVLIEAYAGVVAARYDAPDHVDGELVLEAVDGKPTPYEVSRDLRCARTVARSILKHFEEYQSHAGIDENIIDNVRDKLDINPDAEPATVTGQSRGGRYDE